MAADSSLEVEQFSADVRLNDVVQAPADSIENGSIRFHRTVSNGTTEGKVISYNEMLEGAKKIAEKLHDVSKMYSIPENSIVGIHSFPSIWTPSILIGILRVRFAFIYLSTRENEPYLREVMEEANVSIVITFHCEKDRKLPTLSYACQWIPLDEAQTVWLSIGIPKEIPEKTAKIPTPFAFLMRTSGSTGKPKIVRVTHSSIVPNIIDFRRIFDCTSKDVFFLASPLSFDPSIVEIFTALSSGASLIMVEDTIKIRPSLLTKLLISEQVSILMMTPTLFLSLDLDKLLDESSSLRIVVLGGEKFPNLEIIARKKHPQNRTRFFNVYGLTEVSCWASIHELTSSIAAVQSKKHVDLSADSSLLGVSLTGTELKVVSDREEEVFVGEGELLVCSRTRFCLIGDERNIQPDGNGVLWRKTGDFAYISKEGIRFVGRKDRLLKRNGMRLDLQEIENVVTRGSNGNGAVVAMDPETQLIYAALIVSSLEESETAVLNAKRSAQRLLPQHSQPDYFLPCSESPAKINNHGKLDERLTLLSLKGLHFKASRKRSLKDLDSEVIMNELQIIVRETPLTQASKFLEIGLNSIDFITFLTNCEERLEKSLPSALNLLYGNCSIENFIEYAATCETGISGSKRIKSLTSNAQEKSSQSISVEFRWKLNAGKCIDATPLFVPESWPSNNKKSSSMESCVIVGSHSGLLVCANADTGETLWTTDLGDRIVGSPSITSDGNLIVCGCFDSCIYFLRLSDGTVDFKVKTGDIVKATPTIHPTKEKVFIGSHDRNLYCIDTGRKDVEWTSELRTGAVASGACFSSPIDFIFVATLGSSVHSLTTCNGREVWSVNLGKPIFGGLQLVTLSSSTVLLAPRVDGCIMLLNPSCGSVLHSFSVPSSIFLAPTLIKNKSDWLLTTGGSFAKISEDDGIIKTGILRTYSKEDSPIVGSSANYETATEKLCISITQSGQIRVEDVESGMILCSANVPGEVFSSPVISPGGDIYFGCRDNNLYCFSLHSDG